MTNLLKISLKFSNLASHNYTSLHDVGTSLFHNTKRYLNVTEYNGMNILKSHNVNVPMYMLARTHIEAESASREILNAARCKKLMVKAQVLAGGRGKGTFSNTNISGVEVVSSSREAMECAKAMIGNTLKTKQTAGKGLLCNEVLVAEKLDLVNERYLAFMLDRQSGGIMIIATRHGGGNVEEISENDPNAVLKHPISPLKGITTDDIKKVAKHLEFSSDIDNEVEDMVLKLYNVFISTDALLLEINPLAESNDKKLLACDSKFNIDDNAKYRQEKIFKDVVEPATREEAEANKVGLNYISLDGNVACIVNGAGLAMVTLDLINHHGGSPANFWMLVGAQPVTCYQKRCTS